MRGDCANRWYGTPPCGSGVSCFPGSPCVMTWDPNRTEMGGDMIRRRAALAAASALAVLVTVAGCGGESESEKEAEREAAGAAAGKDCSTVEGIAGSPERQPPSDVPLVEGAHVYMSQGPFGKTEEFF